MFLDLLDKVRSYLLLRHPDVSTEDVEKWVRDVCTEKMKDCHFYDNLYLEVDAFLSDGVDNATSDEVKSFIRTATEERMKWMSQKDSELCFCCELPFEAEGHINECPYRKEV